MRWWDRLPVYLLSRQRPRRVDAEFLAASD
ncbi:hypothetical protein PR001_g7875 [Phytophthora rubi]|uniref:Uncharacterized protein n=1 Tax=Phytophthora rubi TaxID=129364 RepID=A0A6A3N5F0_9STRA|nr:hypothetical protein PR001_g7875 [Phytophthora rubi]